MSKMIGNRLKSRGKGNGYFSCPYWCCGYETDKTTAKRREEAEAFRLEALAEEEHPPDLCHDEKTGMVGCKYCYPEDYEGNGPEDLEGIEGVTFGERKETP